MTALLQIRAAHAGDDRQFVTAVCALLDGGG